MHSSPSQKIQHQLTTAQQLLEAILSPSVHYSPPLNSSRGGVTTKASPISSNPSGIGSTISKGLDLYRTELQHRSSALIKKHGDNADANNIYQERLIDGIRTPNTDISAISQSTSIIMPSASLPVDTMGFTHFTHITQYPVSQHGGYEVEPAELPKTGVVAARLRAIRERITLHNFHSTN